MWVVISLCSIVFNIVVGQQVQEPPSVVISQGTVVGSIAEDGDYYQYLGIPYADSTSGSHRFRAPSPPPSFEDIFVADRKNIKCVKAFGDGYEGTEDCLVANVFTPIENNKPLPVIVWVKGQEFDQKDQPELSFKNFVEKDVIVVTLNYRESILGFLCLGTKTAPGNSGLKDIISGLRWIQANIAHFGGDPDNVSLFGHGSGAASVDLITMSPMANGLVHKAVAQSGTAIAPWAVTRDNIEYALIVANALGHTVNNVEDLSDIFTKVSVAALMAVINELELTDNSLAFAPCLEKDILDTDHEPFLVKSPYQTIADGEFLKIPFITGFVDSEGTIRLEEASNWIEKMEDSLNDFIQPDLKFANLEEKAEIIKEIKNFYFNDGISLKEYVKCHGDTMILVSAIREANMRVNVSNSPLYVYQFSYKGHLGAGFAGSLFLENAAHGEELAYLFRDSTETEVPERDLVISDLLIERQPTSESSQIDWHPFTSSESYLLRFLDEEESNEATLERQVQEPHQQTVAFWNFIYESHFLDAEGKWELTERTDDDDETVAVSEEEEEIEEGDSEEVIEAETEDKDEDGEPDSASTAVGYTFLIVSVFALLNKIHCSQILS